MLGKLIKYDMKTLSRFLVLIHIPMIVLAIIGRYFGVERILAVGKPELPSVLSLLLCIIYWSFISIFTLLYAAVYTYRNLFMHEGYLTLTLPVKTSTQLWAKLLSGALWILIDSLILYVSLIIVVSVPELLAEMQKTMPAVLALFQFSNPSALGWLMSALTLVGAFGNMAIILGSLSLGHCFRKHRVLISILSYCGFLTINQMVGGAIGAAASIRNFQYLEATGQQMPDSAIFNFYHSLFGITMVLMIIFSIASFIFSCHVLKKRVNLD